MKDCSKPSAVRKNPCLKSTMNQLYEQRHETGDIKFIIGSEEIPAHRCVLAALSPKYKAQFYGAMAEMDVVNANGVSAAAFKEFLQFFYADDVTLTLENIEDVLNLAKQSLVDDLVTECENFLFDVVGLDKLVRCYQLAIDYEIKPLEQFCVEHIRVNIKRVFQTNDFLSCERKMLCRILDFDSLNCSETAVFDACISWSRAKCELKRIYEATTANLRAALGDAIYKIRFCSMTAEQFATIDKNYLGLLSSQESIEVYRAIALKSSREISNTFGEANGILRIQPTLECSFSKGSPIKFDISANGDCMDFTCDKTIYLNGFVFCNRIDVDVAVKVKISDDEQSVDSTKSISGNKTKIVFGDPIEVKANETCRIDILFEQSCVGLHGFNILESVQQNGVLFQFDEDFCDHINFITRLLFNTID